MDDLPDFRAFVRARCCSPPSEHWFGIRGMTYDDIFESTMEALADYVDEIRKRADAPPVA